MTATARKHVLFLVVCGSPRAARIGELVTLAQRDEWEVFPIATADGLKFMDVSAVEELTGQPVRHRFRGPGEPKSLPPPDGIIVCPATFNSVNKIAAGISDSLALGVIAEAIGAGTPVVVAPALNAAQAAHRAFGRSVEELRASGVNVLYGPGVYAPAEPGHGDRPYPFDLPMRELRAMLDQ